MEQNTEVQLTPKEIVSQLDQYIVGQKQAKKLVAIALRNRWRRQKIPTEFRDEIVPKNILMIGATGVGKTEIARRLSKILHAPFLKVEASKYTEVGYVGRDVESMVRDLVEASRSLVKEERFQKVKEKAKDLAEQRVLKKIAPEPPVTLADDITNESYVETKEKFLKKLRAKELDSHWIEIETTEKPNPMFEIFPVMGHPEGMDNLKDMLSNLLPKGAKSRKVTVKEALRIFEAEEADKLIDNEDLNAEAIARAENLGIIFIDEIDKIAKRHSEGSAEISREGVQRDLLPIIEGCVVNTKYGNIRTDFILFVAAGAFHISKPSDLIPELQGRFPIRVELENLTQNDLYRILKEPKHSLVFQYQQLLLVEDVKLELDEDALQELAKIAFDLNAQNENIGARRLQSIMEKVLEEVSFGNEGKAGEVFMITKAYIQNALGDLLKRQDLARYIL